MAVCAFIQARMSSGRFPGKVLAPFRGEPLIRHVVAAVEQVLPLDQIIVITSAEKSDDPLASYLGICGINVFRGPLENVFARVRAALSAHSCDWVLRLSADSPLLDSRLLQAVLDRPDDCDLVTTIFPRTFPKGQNAELIRVSKLLAIDEEELTTNDKEHVTPYFYRNADRFRIVNVESGNPLLSNLSFAVDTVDDLSRLEQSSNHEMQKYFSAFSLSRSAD